MSSTPPTAFFLTPTSLNSLAADLLADPEMRWEKPRQGEGDVAVARWRGIPVGLSHIGIDAAVLGNGQVLQGIPVES